MEMQDISVEKKLNQEDEGAGELMVDVETQGEQEINETGPMWKCKLHIATWQKCAVWMSEMELSKYSKSK